MDILTKITILVLCCNLNILFMDIYLKLLNDRFSYTVLILTFSFKFNTIHCNDSLVNYSTTVHQSVTHYYPFFDKKLKKHYCKININSSLQWKSYISHFNNMTMWAITVTRKSSESTLFVVFFVPHLILLLFVLVILKLESIQTVLKSYFRKKKVYKLLNYIYIVIKKLNYIDVKSRRT